MKTHTYSVSKHEPKRNNFANDGWKKKEMQKTSVICLNNAYVYSLRILNLHTVTP